MLDFDHLAIMVYGIPASDDPSPSTQVEHNISKLRMYFSRIFAEDESVSVCKIYRVGPVGNNGDNRPRPLKVILSSEQDLKLLLSRKRKLVCFAPNIVFNRNHSLPERLNQGETKRIIRDGRLYHAP